MGSSTSFGTKKRPAGKQWRSSSSKEIFDNLYANVDAAFAALEAAVSAGYAPVKWASTGNKSNLSAVTVANFDGNGNNLVAGDRVLLKDQNTASQNGIYVVGTIANGTAPLTRATDMAASATFTDGDGVWCQAGDANGNKEFRLTTTGVVGTNNIAYVTLTTSINAGSITATELADDSVVTAKILDANVTAAKLAASSVTGAKVAALADDAVSPQVLVTVAVALADAAGDEDVTLTLPAGQTYEIADVVIHQAGVGHAGNSYTVKKSDSAISAAITGSTTDGAVLRLGSIAAANKAANSFANTNVLRIVVAKGGGTAAGTAFVTFRRLT